MDIYSLFAVLSDKRQIFIDLFRPIITEIRGIICLTRTIIQFRLLIRLKIMGLWGVITPYEKTYPENVYGGLNIFHNALCSGKNSEAASLDLSDIARKRNTAQFD